MLEAFGRLVGSHSSRQQIISHSIISAALARSCWQSRPAALGRSEWSSEPERQRMRQ